MIREKFLIFFIKLITHCSKGTIPIFNKSKTKKRISDFKIRKIIIQIVESSWIIKNFKEKENFDIHQIKSKEILNNPIHSVIIEILEI